MGSRWSATSFAPMRIARPSALQSFRDTCVDYPVHRVSLEFFGRATASSQPWQRVDFRHANRAPSSWSSTAVMNGCRPRSHRIARSS